jgi:hypothetical protein
MTNVLHWSMVIIVYSSLLLYSSPSVQKRILLVLTAILSCHWNWAPQPMPDR